VIAWNGDSLKVDYQKDGPSLWPDQANVLTAEDALDCCERMGYPIDDQSLDWGRQGHP
jgi:hypothetical protein